MKKIIYGVLLGLMCFILPVCAETTPDVSPTLTLNHLTYVPKHKAQIINHMLYISDEDLADMTYGKLQTENSYKVLKIQNDQLTYSGNSRYIKLNGISKLLEYSTQTIADTTYLPVCVLDILKYNYTYEEAAGTFDLVPLSPYSSATDTYEQHKLLPTESKTLDEVLAPLMESYKASPLIKTAKAQNQYITFITTKYKSEALKAIRDLTLEQSKKGYQMTVHLRHLDHSGKLPKLSAFKTLPIHYEFSSTNGLTLSLGDTTCANPFFWSAYNPNRRDGTDIDLNKSLDAMIMRSIYTYYRDQYALKDDTHTDPITLIQMGRSDSIRYTVYIDQPSTQYDIIIYKTCTANTADYYVDFMTK